MFIPNRSGSRGRTAGNFRRDRKLCTPLFQCAEALIALSRRCERSSGAGHSVLSVVAIPLRTVSVSDDLVSTPVPSSIPPNNAARRDCSDRHVALAAYTCGGGSRILAVLLLLLTACRSAESPRSTLATDTLRIEGPLASLQDDGVEGAAAFTDVRSGAFINDTSFVVADSRGRLVVVSTTGRLLREVGRLGSGPGEYRIPMLVTARRDSFALWDAGLRRMSWFRLDGQLLHVQQLAQAQSAMPVVPVPSAFLTVAESGQLSDTAPAQGALIRIRVDSGRVDTLFGPYVVPEFGWQLTDERSGAGRMVNPPLFSVAPMWRVLDDSLVVWVHAGTGRIVLLDAVNGTVRREEQLERKQRPVSDADRDLYFAAVSERMGIGPISAELRANVNVSPVFPVASRVLVDGCSVWAADVDPTGRDESSWLGSAWEVRDVCIGQSSVVILPAGVELLDVRGALMIGVRPDETGVQRVHVFQARNR